MNNRLRNESADKSFLERLKNTVTVFNSINFNTVMASAIIVTNDNIL